MGMIYQWRNKWSAGVDAQVAGEALERIGEGNIGAVQPQAVVDAARPVEHPLHPVFEWDDGIAAEAHRRAQARHMIGAIVTVAHEHRPEAKPVRAYVSITRGAEPAYVPIRTALADADMRQQVLAHAMRELVAWRQRHREIEELAALFDQIDYLDEQRRQEAEQHKKDEEDRRGE